MRREVESFGRELMIEQDLGIVNKEAGAIIWDCALVMMKSFENLDKYPEGFFQGKKILELGSGTGVLGICLLLLGANVTFTDRQVLLPLIQLNIKQNCPDVPSDQYTVTELNWGETPITEDYDIVICCDCIYESEEMWTPLAKCLLDISDRNPETDIQFCYELRSKKDAAFFPYITRHFTVTTVDDDDYHPDFFCPEIKLFSLKRKLANDPNTDPLQITDIWEPVTTKSEEVLDETNI